MAPFIRTGVNALRSSLYSQRERCLLQLPESSYLKWRWYAESAVLEDASQTVNETAGEDGAASKGSDSLKIGENVDSHKATKETSMAEVKHEQAPQKSSTDNLTNLILGKMRSKIKSDGLNKENATPLHLGSISSRVRELPAESKEPDKWEQVMISMRNMANKRREGLGAKANSEPTSCKLEDKEDQDDFADLDLPSGQLSKALSNSGNSLSTDDAFKKFLANSKQREPAGIQASDAKQKIKEAKPVSFSFLKALDKAVTPPRGREGFSEKNAGISSGSKSQDNGLQGSTLASRKEAKPVSFEPKSPSLTGVSSSRNDELRNFPDKTSLKADRVLNEKPSDVSKNNTLSSHLGHMVCIQNLSSQSNLALIKEALSTHGEVISSFKKPNSDGSCCAFIEFKTVEAMDEALASRWLQIDSKVYGIVRADSPLTTVVRLSRVSACTTESQLRSICEKFGDVDNTWKRGKGIYDVFYKVADLSKISSILDSLNEVTLHESRWVALPAPLLHPTVKRSVLNSSQGQAWHAQQLSQTLARIEAGLQTVSCNFEDLKVLITMEDEMTK